MNGSPVSSSAQPLGIVTKDDVVIVGSAAFQIVAGEATLHRDGSLDGNYESFAISPDMVDDLHDDGTRIFEVSDSFVGRWR